MKQARKRGFSPAADVDVLYVRRLLAAARRAESLRGDPVAGELLRLTKSTNLAEAVRKLVDLTFRDTGQMGARLSELILRSDLGPPVAFTDVAAGMGFSLRQFFRYRARAVELMAGELRLMLREPAEGADPLTSLFDTLVNWDPEGAIDVFAAVPEPAGESEVLDALKAYVETAKEIPHGLFERASARNAASALAVRAQQQCLFGETTPAREDLRRAEGALFSIAQPVAQKQARREIAHAEVLLAYVAGKSSQRTFVRASPAAEGDFDDAVAFLDWLWCSGQFETFDAELQQAMGAAQRRRDVIAASRLCLLAAVAIACGGDVLGARRYAAAARTAARHHVWLSADALLLDRRLELISGATSRRAEFFEALPAMSWHRTMSGCIDARTLLAERRLMECKNLSRQCLGIAVERGYESLSAHCECTLAAVEGLEGDTDAERRRYLRAWRWYVQTQDARISIDLFTPPHARWREIGVLTFADAGAGAPFDQANSRRTLAALIPITERRVWLMKQ